MGKKGDKHTQNAEEAAAHLVEALSGIGDITSRKMFGGHGIFHQGKMFAMIDSSGNAFLRSDEFLLTRFKKAGSEKHGGMPYYSIPESVMDDHEELLIWANDSIRASKG